MNFVSIRIITADVKRLAHSYEQITGLSVTMYTEDFGELKTPACTLAIGSTRTLQLFGGDVARPADNHTAIIEFRVGDVDAEYRHQAAGGAAVATQVGEPRSWRGPRAVPRDGWAAMGESCRWPRQV